MPAVLVLLAAVAVGTAGCSGPDSAAVTPSVPEATWVEPSMPQVPTSTPPAPATTSPPLVKADHLARSVPVRLQIAAIGVDSKLMDLGLRDNGTLEVPPGGFPAGWYTGMSTPGELGPAIIVGHVDMNGPGVFYRLRNLKPGDRVTVTRADGSKPAFRVTRVAQFPKNQFPTQQVYGQVNRPVLRLITCGGSFNSASGHYEDNIVAFADLLAP